MRYWSGGGYELLSKSFGGDEGDDDLLTPSLGGRWADGGSFPFKRGGDGGGIVLGLLRHEDGNDLAKDEWIYVRLSTCIT